MQAAVLPTAIGAASIAVMLAAGWFIGGAVARWMGCPARDHGDRCAGCVFTVRASVFLPLVALAAYGIGAVILDVLP